MGKESRYKLSFTAASLRLNEMVTVARVALENDTTNLFDVREKGVVLSSLKKISSTKIFREIKNRLEKLTPDQMNILAHGDLIAQKQIGFLAVCKHYDFIRDFTVEVIRDKALMYDYKINESDYITFINSRIQLHPELDEFTEYTMKKAKQVMFLILEQVGVINSITDKIIQPQLLQPEVINTILKDNPEWLKIFMMTDKDIKQLRY
jgi:hypothetical protein